MSIFKHIAHPVFDEVPGQPKGKSSINPKTGKREYFVASAIQAAPAVLGALTATPPPYMSGIQGSLTTSLGGMLGGIAPQGAEGGANKYMRSIKALATNNNPALVGKLKDVGIKPANGSNFTGSDIRNVELSGYLNPKQDNMQNEMMRNGWAQSHEGQAYNADRIKNLQDLQQQQAQDQYNQQSRYGYPDMQKYQQQQYPQYQQMPQQQPQFLVPDDVVHQRISGVMNRAPDIMDRMQQEAQGYNQDQY